MSAPSRGWWRVVRGPHIDFMQPQRGFQALTLLVHAAHRRVTTAAVGMDARPVRSPVRASRSSTRASPSRPARRQDRARPLRPRRPNHPRSSASMVVQLPTMHRPAREELSSVPGVPVTVRSPRRCARKDRTTSARTRTAGHTAEGASGEPIPNRDTPVQASHRGPEQLPADFDIRAWRAKSGLPARIDNPAVIEAVVALLARDPTPRLAASEERSRPSQGRTGRRNACQTGPVDADSA
jgi:hypothetical protein